MNTNLYIRRTSTPNPLSRAGYAMFVVLSEYSTIRSYGKYIFLFDGRNHHHIMDLKRKIIVAWELFKESGGIDTWFGGDLSSHESEKGEDIVELFNPDNIVNSAGGWDDEDLVSWLWEYVLDPNNIDAVITYDGAVVFNKNLIKQVSEEYLETIVEEENMNTGKDYIMEIQEEVRLPQGDSELVLEKGDRIQVVKEGVYSPEWINSIDFSNLIYTLQGMRIPVDSIMFTEESQYKDKYFAEVEPRFFSIKDLGVFSNALKSARLKIVGNVPRIGDSMWFDIFIEYTTKTNGLNTLHLLYATWYPIRKSWEYNFK